MSSDATRLVQFKREIADLYPDFEKRVTQAFHEVVNELEKVTNEIAQAGPSYLPSINYDQLGSVSDDKLAEIKRKGSLIIRGVVPRKEAEGYKTDLQAFVDANPNVEGVPENRKQYYQIFYTKPQVQARSHPNMLAVSTWLNQLYSLPADSSQISEQQVDLKTPLTYVDRFRIRQPGVSWGAHPPHVDGGSIERWIDPLFRQCFESILRGDWRKHNPYTLTGRLGERTAGLGLPNQASIFRTFQGWLAVSETGPNQGTLKVFPDINLSTAYIMLRPFFECSVDTSSPEALDLKNWRYDISQPTFPGVSTDASAGKAGAARPFEFSPASHPHMRLDDTMISVPDVVPGDTVFWQADVVHAVEKEHNGTGDSSVMYIPAAPACKQNIEYVRKQAQRFRDGQVAPPDFPQQRPDGQYKLCATEADILSAEGRRAMGLTT